MITNSMRAQLSGAESREDSTVVGPERIGRLDAGALPNFNPPVRRTRYGL